MSQDNRVSITIPPTLITQALDHLNQFSALMMPYLTGLSVEDRKTMVKMSDGTLAFVEKTGLFAKSNPEFSPNFLDVNEMIKDLEAATALKPIFDAAAIICSNVEDTMMLCGSEAYLGARYYYNSVSYAAKQGNLSAKPIAEDLSKRFQKRGKVKKTNT